jgi:hypothetical protein
MFKFLCEFCRKGRNLLQRVRELEGQMEGLKKDKQKFELAAEENERKFRSANAKLQNAEQRADGASGKSKVRIHCFYSFLILI